MGFEGLPHTVVEETDVFHLFLFEDVAAIENIGWSFHFIVEATIIQRLENIPLGENYDCVGALYCFLGAWQLFQAF